MLEKSFSDVYSKFKVHFYKQVFERMNEREASLSTLETFCIEVIHVLNSPTVNEFATFLNISPPNAAYKVNSLMQKGYLEKVQSHNDKREYHLKVTAKYFQYYNLGHNYIKTVIGRIEENFSKEEVQKLDAMLTMMSNQLMPETQLPEG